MNTGLDAIGPGLMLGRYELLMPIARGGMAAVWAARAQGARGFETIVAIKTMLPDISDNVDAIDMFLDEARVASRVRHPNVVQVLDLGEHQELLYQVMEWIEGDSLSTIMREAIAQSHRLTLPIIGRILIDACAGLHAAHELKDDNGQLIGLVHRDISPQNILISIDGLVKVADFGIAKSSDRKTSETAPGLIKGKMSYIAPEQAMSAAIDRRSDIFALGVILYQLLTSKHPFRGDNELSTLQNLLTRPIPAPSVMTAETMPPDLDNVVMKALQRQPGDRYATALEFGRAVERSLSREMELATTGELAEFLTHVVGQRNRDRRANLKFAQSELQNRRSSAVSLLAVTAPRSNGTDISAHWQIDPQMFESPTKVDISTSHTMMTDMFESGIKSRRRTRAWVGAGVALFALAGGGLFLMGRSSSSQDSQTAQPALARSMSSPLPVVSAIMPTEPVAAVSSSVAAEVVGPMKTSSMEAGAGRGKSGKSPPMPGGHGTTPPLPPAKTASPPENRTGVSEPGFLVRTTALTTTGKLKHDLILAYEAKFVARGAFDRSRMLS